MGTLQSAIAARKPQPQPRTVPEWVRRAQSAKLPPKVLAR